MNTKELRKLIREEIKRVLIEAPITPTGPDGEKISDPTVIKNLNMALKAVSSSLRPKLIQMIEDPASAKSLASASQRAAVIGAMAIAFGISEQEFGQIVGKIKGMLKKTGGTEPAKPE